VKRKAFQLAAYFLQKYDRKKIGLKHLLTDEYITSISNTHFVSSRGILHSCDIKPENPRSSSTDIAYLNNLDRTWGSLQDDFAANRRTKPPATIYVCTDALPHFSVDVLPKIKWKFNLVSGDSDTGVSPEIQGDAFFSIINSPYLNDWFAQNKKVSFDKLLSLPIGLDFHTLWNDPLAFGGGPLLPSSQESGLWSVSNNAPSLSDRVLKMYCNWHFQINRGDRLNCLSAIDKSLCYFEENFCNRHQTWINQSKYVFVLSPEGGGVDCHRTWEALALGCIPIVKRSAFSDLFQNLPVLIVDDWGDINLQMLRDTLIRYENTQLHKKELTNQYWVGKISELC
jgi:hypothetical protein